MDEKPAGSSDKNEIFIQLARLSVAGSITCLVALAGMSLHIMNDAERLLLDATHHGIEYLTKTEALWIQMVRMREEIGGRQRSIQRFTRSYDPFKEILQKCNSCVRLSCAPGPIGPVGEPGTDGTPGTSGSQGTSGADGVDIILGPFPDLPCVVCPGGHPGPRGEVGERGWPGEAGGKGIGGPSGQPGPNGLPGHVGVPGSPGRNGQSGLPGAPGDSVVGGTGIKGPKGERGRAGFVGLVGIPGRASNIPGKPGSQGVIGPPGQPGNVGIPGQIGAAGVPGEMGTIQPFCISDCSPYKSAQPHASAAMLAANSQQFAFPLAFASSGGPGDDYETLEVLNDS